MFIKPFTTLLVIIYICWERANPWHYTSAKIFLKDHLIYCQTNQTTS